MAPSIRRLESVRRLQEMHKESTGTVSFFRKLATCLVGGGTIAMVCCILIIGLAGLGLSIAKIAIGSMHINDCPAEPMVAIYLIVGGVMSLVANCSCRPSKNEEGGYKIACEGAGAVVGLLIGVFALVWMIVGTVFVIRTNSEVTACQALEVTTLAPVVNMTSTEVASYCPQCNEFLLTFAFAIVIVEWCFFGVIILLGFCCCCLPLCLGKCSTDDQV